jgi:hypothetical protein
MTQLDLLELLAAPTPEYDRDADILARYLPDWQLAQIIRALDNPVRLRQIQQETVNGHSCMFGPRYSLETTKKGVHVREWFDQGTWDIPWRRVFQVVRERTTPAAAARLEEAYEALCQHRVADPRDGRSTIHRRLRTEAEHAEEERFWRQELSVYIHRGVELTSALETAARAILPDCSTPLPGPWRRLALDEAAAKETIC